MFWGLGRKNIKRAPAVCSWAPLCRKPRHIYNEERALYHVLSTGRIHGGILLHFSDLCSIIAISKSRGKICDKTTLTEYHSTAKISWPSYLFSRCKTTCGNKDKSWKWTPIWFYFYHQQNQRNSAELWRISLQLQESLSLTSHNPLRPPWIIYM